LKVLRLAGVKLTLGGRDKFREELSSTVSIMGSIGATVGLGDLILIRFIGLATFELEFLDFHSLLLLLLFTRNFLGECVNACVENSGFNLSKLNLYLF